MARNLENAGEETPPRRPGLHLLALAVNEVPVELTTTSVDIHLCGSEPALALPKVTCEPESSDDEGSKVGLKEVRGSTSLLTRRKTKGRNSGVELWLVLECTES
jgi:hypothetical protein